MNKIYNNLNIENLMKTKMFNQFNDFQQEEIIKGLKDSLDISFYNKPYFNYLQMGLIRTGLENNLDVSIYAKKHFNEYQMFQIKVGLEDN